MSLNIFERAIATISPRIAARRMYYRSAMNTMSSGYIAASTSHQAMRLFNPLAQSADNDGVPNLDLMRSRSRDMVRNTAIGKGVVDTIVTGVLGEGLRLNSTITASALDITDDDATKLEKQIESEFTLWCESVFCDTERSLDFYGLQELTLRSMLENGDVFALITRRNSGSAYDLSINLIEADLCRTPFSLTSEKSIIAGIRKDEFGAPASYFFTVPEDAISDVYSIYAPTKYKEIPAYNKTNKRQILHIMDKLRVGQTRGIPLLAPVMQLVKQIERYSEAELAAAVIAGNFTVFIQDEDMNDGIIDRADVQEDKVEKNDIALAPGAIVQLDKGKKIETANPARPNSQYEPFIVTVLKQIGMGLQVPYEVLFKHFASSYSASQGALLEASKLFSRRRAHFIRSFCKPIYEQFMTEAITKGRISAPGFFEDVRKRQAYLSAEWIGPKRGMIDEMKEVNAAVARINAGLSTRKREAPLQSGMNIDDIHEQRKREILQAKELQTLIGGTREFNHTINKDAMDD